MARVKRQPSAPRATLIGDVVGSRRFPDRRDLHRRVTAALATAIQGAVDPPALTVGDEFQGSYPTVGLAIDAALTLRLALAPDVDIRFGLGWGSVTTLDEESGIQDGPGWWSAREAIEWTATTQQQPGMTHVRTAFRNDTGGGADPRAVNAALMCRDHLLGSLDERSLRILAGMRAGRSKKELAVAEGISASAVSQRAGRAGLDLLLAAAAELREL
ncbi:MAG: SatD family protein [Actinomycetota bacterium]